MHELTEREWNAVQHDLNDGLDAFRSVYGDDDNDNVVVQDEDGIAVFADGSGHELNEIAERTGVDRSRLSRRMHDEARRHTDYNWSAADPIVIEVAE